MFPSLLRYHSKRYRVLFYALTLIVCAASFGRADAPKGALLCDPVSLALTLALSAGLSLASQSINAYQVNRRNRKNPIDKGRNDDLRITASEYGAAVPILKGKGRFAGNIIDGQDIEVQRRTTQGARVKKVRPPDTIEYIYACHFYVLLCEGPITDVLRIWMDADIIYNKNATGTGGGNFNGLRKDVSGVIDLTADYPADEDDPGDFYHAARTEDSDSISGDFHSGSWRVWKGTPTQAQDPDLVAIHGAANTPAYRNRCYARVYVLVKDGRVPNFTFEIDEGTTEAGDTVVSLYSLNGVTSAELEVAALSADEQDGIVIANRQQLKQPLDDLGIYHKFDMVDVDGKLKAVKRDGASVVIIPSTDLRAHDAEEEEPDYDALVEDTDELTRPARVEVGYIDASPGADYHHNVQVAEAFIGNAQDMTNVNLPIVMTPDSAKQLAEYLCARGHIESRTVQFQTGWKYLFLHPNDVVTLEADGVSLVVRITQMNMAIPAGVIKFQGVVQESTILTQSATGSAGSGLEAPIIAFPGNQRLVLLESPPIHDGEDQLLLFAGSALRGDGVARGAFLYRATAAGVYDDLVATFPEESTIGLTASVLAEAEPYLFDTTSSLTVDLFRGTLTSCTQSELLADAYLNLLAVKNAGGEVEYIQFTTATPETAAFPYTARYALSGFMRGRFATEDAAAGHAAGCDVLLMDGTVRRVEFEAADIGRTLSFKSVSSGQQVTDAVAKDIMVAGYTLKPPAPVNVRGTRNVDGDVLIEWTRRARIAGGLRDFADTPLGEESEIYRLDIFEDDTFTAPPLRSVRALNGMDLPAVLISSGTSTVNGKNYDFDHVEGNTLSGVGSGIFAPVSSFYAASLQVIREAGNFVEATLTFSEDPSDRFGRAALGLSAAEPEDADLASLESITPAYLMTVLETVTPGEGNLTISVDGVDVYGPVGVANNTRAHVQISAGEVRFYLNYTGPGSAPIYVSPVAPVFPLRAYARAAKEGSEIGKIVMSQSPNPATIYSAAQHVENGLTPGDPVSIEICQISAVVGEGRRRRITI